jgi:Putative lumazine-binding
MKKITVLKATVILLLSVVAVLPARAQKEEKAIKDVINRFFDAMASGDTATLKATCTETPVFQTFMKDKDGNLQVYTEDFNDFIKFVGSPSQDKFKEELKFEAIHAEMSLASVWTPYTFYLNGKVSHCGTNSFQLVKTAEGWKIQYILDTRRKGCK